MVRVKRKTIIPICISLVLLGLWYGYGTRNHLTEEKTPIVWAGPGVSTSTDAGKSRVAYSLPNKDNTMGIPPDFALRKNEIVYWSQPDKAICIVDNTLRKRWLYIDKHLRRVSVDDIRATPQYVFLNSHSMIGVIRVHTGTGSCYRMPDTAEARSYPTCSSYAVLSQQGNFVIYTSNRRIEVKPEGLPKKIIDWDYDPILHQFVITDGHKVYLLQRDGQVKTLRYLPNTDCILFQPHAKQIWAVQHGLLPPYTYTQKVVVLDYSGKVHGIRLETTGPPIHPPIMSLDSANYNTVARILRHIAHGKVMY